ncbi:hypothetical protein [Streptosporangium sp. NPDC049376]|uniref:hypothetical protein n=1 Tax=Streptosporangium sp. NPDC049376 TaxID=3366192 RepID=UPI00379226E7
MKITWQGRFQNHQHGSRRIVHGGQHAEDGLGAAEQLALLFSGTASCEAFGDVVEPHVLDRLEVLAHSLPQRFGLASLTSTPTVAGSNPAGRASHDQPKDPLTSGDAGQRLS